MWKESRRGRSFFMGPKKSKRRRSKHVRDLTFGWLSSWVRGVCIPRGSRVPQVCCRTWFRWTMRCHAVRNAPGLESQVPSWLSGWLGLPPEGGKNPCSIFTSQSFLILIQHRKEWDQIICHVSLTPDGILERKMKNKQRNKWQEEITQKGPKNFWDCLLPFCCCPTSAFVLRSTSVFPFCLSI